MRLWQARKTVIVGLLLSMIFLWVLTTTPGVFLGCGGPPPGNFVCMNSDEPPPLGHWKLMYDDKAAHYVTIDKDTCTSSMGKKGKTKLRPGRARLDWDDGWTDVILGGNGTFWLWEFEPGKPRLLSEPPTRWGSAQPVETIPQTEKP